MTRRRNQRRRAAGTVPDEPRFQLRDPIDVLAAIPYLVGYHPTESVVLLGMRGTRLMFSARYDLPPPDASHQFLRDAVERMVQVVLRQRITGVLIVGFGANEQVEPLSFALRAAYLRAGLDVLEVLRAEDGRYWSYLCMDPRCCPDEGSPYDPGASALAAEWTVAGRVALPDRETYEKQLLPVDGIARDSIRRATVRADDRLLELLTRPVDEDAAAAALLDAGDEAIDDALALLRGAQPLPDDLVAWLCVLIASANMAETAWRRIKASGADLPLHRTLWMDVMRRAEPDLSPGPGCLFAIAAWQCGEGTLARLALERVLRVDPNYRVAAVLHEMLAQGIPPMGFDEPGDRQVRRRPARDRRKRSSSRRAGSRRA